MTDEIIKLYENAGVRYMNINACKIDETGKDSRCNFYFYPDFTAEKQLELIKWLAVKGDFDSSIDIAKNTYDYWTIYFQDIRWTAEGFEESLAGLINNTIWQDLTEEEKEQIRGILDG